MEKNSRMRAGVNSAPGGCGDFAGCADAVIDAVEGKRQDALFTLAKPGGIIVSSVVRQDAQRAAHRGARADYFIVDVNAVQLARIADTVERNLVRTAVGSILPLVDARVAHEMLAGTRPHERGTIVLRCAVGSPTQLIA
jgi:NADPH:quinone reductase-like Zn-dependent oxidoreductase